MTNPKHIDLLKQAYAAFNARDIETVLALMHPDVEWANGMEGRHVHGRGAVRSYWEHQWTLVDPHVDPIEFQDGENGQIVSSSRLRSIDGTRFSYFSNGRPQSMGDVDFSYFSRGQLQRIEDVSFEYERNGTLKRISADQTRDGLPIVIAP